MVRSFPKVFSKGLDRLVNPWFQIGDRRWSTYQVCGYTGYALAVLLGILLTVNQGLLLWVLAGMTLTTALIFFGLALATKIITGEEQLIYYHHEIAIMAAVALLVWILGQPVLPYLDVTILGIGLFLVFGRVGCLMVGCCHGRPHRWGVCYRQEHADAGFPRYYVGVRLFPIQALESLFVLSVVGVGTGLVLTGHPPGEALAWYVVTYGVARFFFEFSRGDTGRPELLGFSEAQWTSLLLMSAGVFAQSYGLMILHPWHAWATVGLVLTMILVALIRRSRKPAIYELLHPSHVREIAKAVETASQHAIDTNIFSRWHVDSAEVRIGHTSLGVQISAGHIQGADGKIEHYTLSARGEVMTKEYASTLAKLILQLKQLSTPHELIPGSHGVFHVLVHREERISYFPMSAQKLFLQPQ
jgi:Prolipoprotein diacylglyceryl transferase